MNPRPDSQLLLAYAERRSDAAFAELVRRHLNLVHAAALRITRDPDLAKDVSQAVFIALANQAEKLAGHAVLAGWLHRTTRNIAAQSIRTEIRRRAREQAAAILHEPSGDDGNWQQMAPQLDAALADLAAGDRDAILLRYFENRTASEMAGLLGISLEAAQKRVNRAVGRLRAGFGKRGLAVGTAGLADAISANAVPTAPAGMAAGISAAVLSGAGSSTAPLATTARILAMTTSQKCIVAAGLALLAGGGIIQFTLAGNPPEGPASEHQEAMAATKWRSPTTENTRRSQSEHAPIDRQKELVRLKAKWLELKPRGNEGVNDQKKLAKESARLLLCSQEAVELLKFVYESEMWGAGTLEYEIARMFDSPHAAEARALLIGTADEDSYDLRGVSCRETWSKAAGLTCPDDEFESFRDALKSATCAQEALFGRNESLTEDDPIAALLSTVQALDAQVPSATRHSSLEKHCKGDLPPGFDFESFEALLPVGDYKALHDGTSIDPATRGRKLLFEKWAKVDAAAAASFVLANPERCSPALIGAITRTVPLPDPAASPLEWIEQFPAGPCFDEAAQEMSYRLAEGYPDEARQLASRMSDPARRKSSLERIERLQARNRDEFQDGR